MFIQIIIIIEYIIGRRDTSAQNLKVELCLSRLIQNDLRKIIFD